MPSDKAQEMINRRDPILPVYRVEIPPTPVLGSKNPYFTKREFSVKKNPLSSAREHRENGDFIDRKIPFPACVRAKRNGGF